MRWRLALVLVGFTTLVLLVQNIPLASYLRTVEKERIISGLEGDAYSLGGFSVPALVPLPPTTGLTAGNVLYVVPEPGTWLLLSLGLLGLPILARRRRQA